MPEKNIDFAAEGLLDGLEDERRAERIALLEYLTADGVPLSELRRTTATGTVMFLPAERPVREAARDAYRWSHAGERRLRGIREPVALFRARALPTE